VRRRDQPDGPKCRRAAKAIAEPVNVQRTIYVLKKQGIEANGFRK
jgi:hypothetical protein